MTNTAVSQKNYDIKSTTEYDRFTSLTGNRDPRSLHLRRLIESFKKRYLFSPIIVNELYEIIDGQHRFWAAKELGLPVYYIVVQGYGLEEVQILNSNSADWKKLEYLKSYCDLGIKSYLWMQEFMVHYPDFGISVSEQLLTNAVSGANYMQNKHMGGRKKTFQEGGLLIKDLKLAYENADKVMMFKPYYDGYNRSSFVTALIGFFKNENYNHEEMIGKVAQQPSAITHCATAMQYKILLEEIYNYKRRNKINLRY